MPVQFALIKNTAPSPSASRDCICNHGNKTRQHNHCFYEDGGKHTERAKGRRDTKMFMCSLEVCTGSASVLPQPCLGEVRNIGIYFTMEDDPLPSNQTLLSARLCPNLCSIQYFYLKEMANFRSEIVEALWLTCLKPGCFSVKDGWSLVFQLNEIPFSLWFSLFLLSLWLSFYSLWLSLFFLSPLLFHTAGRKEAEEREDAKNSHSFDQTWH